MIKKSFKIEIFTNTVIVFICVSLVMLSINSNKVAIATVSYKDEVFYEGDRNSNNVSLMFNVYWGDEYLEDILNALNEYNAKVTFFVGGSWADDNKQYLQKFLDNNHEIGNHGYFHKSHSKLSFEENYKEIKSTNVIVENLINYKISLFAPPSGDYSKNTVEAAKKLNMQVIMWSIDTIDWKDQNENLIKNRAVKAKSGDLVLMHPTKMTAKALRSILEDYKNRGLNVVKVSENIRQLI